MKYNRIEDLSVNPIVLSCIQVFVTLWTIARQAPLWDCPSKNTGVGCHFFL